MRNVTQRNASSKIDHKSAAVVFLFVIFPSSLFILMSWLGSGTQETEGGNGGIIPMLIMSALMYAIYFVIFFVASRLLDLKGKILYDELNISKKICVKDIVILVLLGGVCIVSFFCVSSVTLQLFESWGFVVPARDIPITNYFEYFLMIIAMCVLPAIVEELIFRGLIFKGFMQFGKIKAIIASAVLFSLYHLNPAQTVYQFVLGLVCAAVFVASGNLIYSMILHFINNFFIITYTYITGDPLLTLTLNTATILVALFLLVFGVSLIVGLVKSLKQHTRSKFGAKRFVSLDNIGYLICVALGAVIWVLQFLN